MASWFSKGDQSVDSLMLIRCLAWDRNGELCSTDRDQVVSVLQSTDRDAAWALTDLRTYRPMPTAA